jgi:hypothetical protein
MINPTELTGSTATLAQAAALLEAVARDSEAAVDFDVPLRCGRAANRLHAALGSTCSQLPFVGDDAAEIAAAIGEATALLSSLPSDEITDPILDALLDARAAAAQLADTSVPAPSTSDAATSPTDPPQAVR